MMYAYTYDGNNRLATANFTKTGVNANGLDEGFAYDVNGNVTKTSRYDYNGVLTDSMKFTYQGNHLSGSYDKQGDVASVVDFPGKTTIQSVNYDQNGNETSEPHRYIATTYNLLNLPKQIIWNGLNRKISYFYTFNGIKRRKTVEDNGIITKVDYCGPFVYETVSGTRSLKYILTPHGRAVKSGSSFEYEYNITDHLGNVRAVIKKYTGGLPMVVQARHYYSFGMEMSQLNNGTTINKYQYNGKEIQDDFGLYWYDYGARFYDPMVGRWHTQDPHAEKYFDNSPYSYALNNPIRFIDPDGNVVVDANGKPINYSAEKGWSPNATENTKNIYKAMIKTETGRTQWNKMVSSKNKISLSISDKIAYSNNEDGKLALGVTNFTRTFDKNTSKYVKTKDQIFEVTIFTGSIKKTQNGGVNSGLTMEEAISATAGHEAEHATNEENIQNAIYNKDLPGFIQNDIESLPNEIGNKIRNEIRNAPKEIESISANAVFTSNDRFNHNK